MSDLELDERRFLERASSGLSPTPADRARVRASLDEFLAAEALGPDAKVDDPSGAAATSLAAGPTWLGALGIAAGVAAAAGAGGYYLGYATAFERAMSTSKPAVATTPTQLEAPASPAGPAAPEAHRPPVQAPAAKSRRPAPSATAPAPLDPGLDEEARMLARVERALRDENPRFALGLLGEMDRTLPGGQLLEERQAARALAHCQLGSEAAAERAREFAERHPQSAYLSRIRQACSVAGKSE